VASELARVGLRSSPKTDTAELPETPHRPDWGRFAAQREQARSPQRFGLSGKVVVLPC